MQITALCVTGAVLSLVVKRGAPEIGLLLALGTATAVLFRLMGDMTDAAVFLRELAERSGVAQALFIPLYKTVGITLVVKIGGSLCRDAGESTLASVVETAGAVCAMLVAVPLLQAVMSLLLELME